MRMRFPLRSDYEIDTHDEPRGCRNFLLFLLTVVAISYTAGASCGYPHVVKECASWLFR